MSKRLMPIEKLLHWAYAEQRVHLNLETGHLVRDVEGESEGPRFCVASVADHSHPDAVTLDRLVSHLSRETRTLVRKHGIAGTRPDWKPAARHRFEPKVWVDVRLRDGRSRREGERQETLSAPDQRYPLIAVNDCGRRLKRDVLEGLYDYVEIVEIDAPHDVARVRAFYGDWIAGLKALRDTLLCHGDSLDDYGVSAMLPLERPWESAQTQRILFAANRTLTCG